MTRITMNKAILYYKNKTYSHFTNIEKIYFNTLQEALNFLKNYQIKSIINKKDISAIEEIYFTTYNGDTFKKYTKTIDFVSGEEITTIPGGEA